MPGAFTKLSASKQLAEQIRRQVEQGTWSIGSRLPSVRALANRFQVSRTTVQKAMRELDDQDVIKLLPRKGGVVQSASSIDVRRKNLVGIIIGLDSSVQIPLWWTHQIIHHAQLTLAESGFVLTLFNFWANKPDYAKQVIDQMSGLMDSLAGAIFFPIDELAGLVDFFDQANLPWMTVNPITLDTHHNYVMADQLAAGRLVGRCFARLGYERVAVVYDDVQNLSPLEKVTGIYQGYLVEGASPYGIKLVRSVNMETDAGYAAMKEHLKTHAPPQGIFATADTLAVGAMRACQELGLRVPEDLGVVGSTGLPDSQLHSDPPLTELRQPVEAIGRQLALCLLEMIRGDVHRISGRRVSSSLELRSSLLVPDDVQRQLRIRPPVGIETPSAELAGVS